MYELEINQACLIIMLELYLLNNGYNDVPNSSKTLLINEELNKRAICTTDFDCAFQFVDVSGHWMTKPSLQKLLQILLTSLKRAKTSKSIGKILT